MPVELDTIQEVNINEVEHLPQGLVIRFSDRRTFYFAITSWSNFVKSMHANWYTDDLSL